MSTTPTIPEGYKADSLGRLVPVANIKPIDLERDTLVDSLVSQARFLNERLRAFRISAHDDIQALAELSAEKYGATLGGKKGNLTLTSYDGRYKVMRAISEQLVFDERLQAAKKLIDECITDWADGARPELRTLIDDAFQVNKQGRIDTARVLSLRRLEIEDPRWKSAMEAISDALQVSNTRSYIRVYERVGNTDRYQQINLDLANA
ncbi:DUF3164 family protein [Actomonas aquatica]|uniref:DUF3164 family protein n=1 Tax=Actomonas aquatica TaxID=2866162 RepID=A0ABZ1CCS9_9BACT|nr:DUF3164 family protein [Opitutus sp. WL0086]WRQ89376.1 DUF3164 family protein [Opitutus sp. WL0086]